VSGKTGFGMGGVLPAPDITEAQKQIIAGDHTALLKGMEESLRKLSDKYAEQPMEQSTIINIPGSATVFSTRLDLSTQEHNALLICVTSGTLNLWLGDYGGVGQTAQPNCGQYGAVSNTELFFALKGRVYTIVNPSATVTLQASIVAIAL
jgi:hypothetical protein